jgi:sortase (surface protein transpeptidase)
MPHLAWRQVAALIAAYVTGWHRADRSRSYAVVAVVLAVIGATMVGHGLGRPGPPRPVLASVAPAAHDVPAVRGVGPAVLQRSVPVHLDIPKIDVHTALMALGLNPDGTVSVPPLRADAPAGWYQHLASPGEIGPAVIVGHVDSANDGPAVFFRLGELRPGDQIAVLRADARTAVFTVMSVAQYPKAAFPSREVYGSVDYAGLRLITCGGDFDRVTRSYRDSLIVYGRLTAVSRAA